MQLQGIRGNKCRTLVGGRFMKQSRDCSECRKPAEPPLVIGRLRLPDELARFVDAESLPFESTFVLCLDCIDRRHEEKEALKEIKKTERAGTVCSFCY